MNPHFERSTRTPWRQARLRRAEAAAVAGAVAVVTVIAGSVTVPAVGAPMRPPVVDAVVGAAPVLTSTPGWAFPGKRVSLTASGLPASIRVAITLDGIGAGVTRTNSTGSFTTTVVVPPVAPGPRIWRASPAGGGAAPKARILIRTNANTWGGGPARTGVNATDTYLTVTNSPEVTQTWSTVLSQDISAVGVYNGVAYVGSFDPLSSSGRTYAVDAGTGKLIWQSPYGLGVLTAPVAVGSYLFLQGPGGSLDVLDRASGTLLTQVGTQVGDTGDVSPVVDWARGVLYQAGRDGVTAVDFTTLKVKWFTPFAFGSGIVSVEAETGRLFTTGQDGLRMLDAETGKLLWDVPSPGSGGTAGSGYPAPIYQGKVYAAWNDGSVAAYDTATGRTVWKRAIALPSANSALAVANGVLVAGSDHGFVGMSGLDPQTGETLWANPDLPSCQGTYCLPFGSATVLYLGGGSGWTPIDPLNGKPTGGSIVRTNGGIPALADGTIFNVLAGALQALTVPAG